MYEPRYTVMPKHIKIPGGLIVYHNMIFVNIKLGIFFIGPHYTPKHEFYESPLTDIFSSKRPRSIRADRVNLVYSVWRRRKTINE